MTESTSTLTIADRGLTPEFFKEGMRTITTVFRTTRKVAEGVERAVDGVDHLVTLALSQQALRIERELTKMSLPA